ncbi:hypothetical protein [Cupriavidus basilensis]
MMRRFACVGDALKDGGEILPYVGRTCTFGDAGHQAAQSASTSVRCGRGILGSIRNC